jgi:hypothetical protein
MTLLAAIRPDGWNVALFLHILGAMVMVGGLVLAVTSLTAAWRGGAAAATRLGYRALVLGVLPGWLVMRGAAQWIANKEGLEDSDLSWIGIGFSTSEGGFLLIIIAMVLAGRAARQGGEGGGTGLKVAAVFAALLIVVYLVAIWAMTTKPA